MTTLQHPDSGKLRTHQTAEQVELATLEYVDWFNHRRLYEACGDIPPAELEDGYYRQNNRLTEAALSET